jgi:hypothetical protein
MCYSAKCHFEDYMGECRVRNFGKFKEQTGEAARYVGGVPDCEESAEYVAENKERFAELQKKAYELKLVW